MGDCISTCKPGYTGNPCKACVAGTYKATDYDASCSSCPVGSNSATASTTPSTCRCNVGYTGPDGCECSVCAADTYRSYMGGPDMNPSDNSALVCTDLPWINYFDATCEEYQEYQEFCYHDAKHYCCVCEGVYVDMYPHVGDNGMDPTSAWSLFLVAQTTPVPTCTSCPANSASPTASTTLSACQCNTGSTGSNRGLCLLCGKGKYKVANGTAVCTDCESGTYSTMVGTTSNICQMCRIYSNSLMAIDECTCKVGYSGRYGASCTFCENGNYEDNTMSGICNLCPDMSTSPAGSSLMGACVCTAGHIRTLQQTRYAITAGVNYTWDRSRDVGTSEYSDTLSKLGI